MKTLRTIFSTIANLFSKQFYFLASLASLVGVLFLIFKERWSIYIALAFFCLMLFMFTACLIYAIFKILEIDNKDFENRSTFIKYETLDGNQIIYETYKLIQSKKPLLLDMAYNFKWTGTHLPVVTSALQQVENIVDEQDPSKYDRAILKFAKPLYYNKNCVVHFKALLDDADHQSLPHVETRVTSEVDIIHYRIILKHKPDDYSSNAILQRKRISSGVNTNFEKIKEIAFDKVTKSYEYHLLNPEIGYYYQISWEA